MRLIREMIRAILKLLDTGKIDMPLRYAQVMQSNVKIAHKKYIG